MESHELINQDSGDFEYYTPQEIIEAAREVLGVIDLDPASSAAANLRVKAARYYSIHDNGLSLPWVGCVFLNHPFSRDGNHTWVRKLQTEYLNGNIHASCNITFASTSEQWFQPLLRQPQCFLVPRTNYILPDGTKKVGVTKGSAVTYFGPHVNRFRLVFSKLGVVKI